MSYWKKLLDYITTRPALLRNWIFTTIIIMLLTAFLGFMVFITLGMIVMGCNELPPPFKP
jgi:hypothetical protein